MHGFDPNSADMHPIFFARGPDFANKKEEQEPFTNLDLYPLCCFLLGIEPAPNNGSLAELHSYLGKILFIYHRKLDVSNCFKFFFYLISCWQFQVINKIFLSRKVKKISNTKWLKRNFFVFLVRPLDLALPIAMGVLFSFFILLVILYAIYQQFWKWKPLTLLQDQDQSNIQYRGLN